jgi:hypothetical protein
MLLDHLEGILNYCRTKIPMGVVEAVNGNIKALLRRGRGYRDMNYLLLKAQRLAATKTEFVASRKPRRMHTLADCCAEPFYGVVLTVFTAAASEENPRPAAKKLWSYMLR